MNTAELVAKIADAHGVSKVQAKSIVDDIFKDIVDSAASGAEVSLPGVQSQGDAGTRGPQSGKWREDQDCGVKEAHFLVRQIGQRPPEWPSRTTRQLKLEQARVLQFERKFAGAGVG
jgi:DNA-binding protein HU-beta